MKWLYEMKNVVDVVIIGAGAAGLMCAAQASQRQRKTLVLDIGKKPGRKILISGGGRCNFTNYDVSAENYLCKNPHFVKSALSQFTQWDFLALVIKHNIEYEERSHGQLFCKDSAKEILTMLLHECDDAWVNFRYQQEISHIEKTEQGWQLMANGQEIHCQSLVIATGGLSMPKLGASAFGHKFAQDLSLTVEPLRAGLVPLTLHQEEKTRFAPLSGIAIDVSISACNKTFKEALLFTHRGLSGPAVLQISSYWQAGMAVTINLLPNIDLTADFEQLRQENPEQSLKNGLAKWLPKRLVEVLIEHFHWKDIALKQLTSKQIATIIDNLSSWEIIPNGTEGYRTAEVTLGGICTDHFSSKTLECKNHAGLYAVGEVLDVSGWLGGYNFQWAWSSGYVAGQYV
jgi:predicted Rossmann fold flavoprotein